MFPKVIASSVIRSSRMGDAHGGLYLVDLNDNNIEKVFDWNDNKIDWDGRGGERGLRGIDFYNDNIYIAASNEIYVFDKNFNVKNILENKYLKYNHEICIHNNNLYITSTGYDSIIIYDIIKNNFITSYCIRTHNQKKREISFWGRKKKYIRNYLNINQKIKLTFYEFDPLTNNGPKEQDTTHINNVFIHNGNLYFSGTILENLYSIENNELKKHVKLHYGTHNVKIYNNGYLLNNTYYNPKQISYLNNNGKLIKSFLIKKYNTEDLNNTNLPDTHAVQAFGRGLCTYGNFIIGGSSPATITIYDFTTQQIIKSINISKDIRNAIHGLEIWPF